LTKTAGWTKRETEALSRHNNLTSLRKTAFVTYSLPTGEFCDFSTYDLLIGIWVKQRNWLTGEELGFACPDEVL
jgi:hypothetical protein